MKYNNPKTKKVGANAEIANTNNTNDNKAKAPSVKKKRLMSLAEKEFMNSHNPDGSERESIKFGTRTVWVRRVNPNRIPELREDVARIMAESFDGALQSLEVVKIFLSEMKWGITEESEKSFLSVIDGTTTRFKDKVYKVQCPGWVSSIHLREDADSRLELILDVALVAHMRQFLKDLKSITDKDIEKWNEGVKNIKKKAEAKKKSKGWVQKNTAVFSMASVFNSLE